MFQLKGETRKHDASVDEPTWTFSVSSYSLSTLYRSLRDWILIETTWRETRTSRGRWNGKWDIEESRYAWFVSLWCEEDNSGTGDNKKIADDLDWLEKEEDHVTIHSVSFRKTWSFHFDSCKFVPFEDEMNGWKSEDTFFLKVVKIQIREKTLKLFLSFQLRLSYVVLKTEIFSSRRKSLKFDFL